MWFIDKLTSIGDPTNVFTSIDILIVLIISTILCFVVAWVYKVTHEGVSYSHTFLQTIVIFGVLVSMIMLIIGSNIARAFTLVGALSIIRFRNAIKDTKDVGFIFFMMAVGMAVGTRFYGLAVIMTGFVSSLFYGMHKYNFGSKKDNDEILKITISQDMDFEKKIEPLLKKWLQSYQLINIEGTKKNLMELVYLVKFDKKLKHKAFLLKAIKDVNNKLPVYMFGTDHLIY